MRKRILIIPLFIIGVLIGWRWIDDHYTVPIMMYHHVDEEGKDRADTISPERFRQHMEYLKVNGYQVIGLDELVQGIKARQKFPHNTVVITFDDGYEDNFLYAFPILKEYRYPVTIFVCPDFIGKEIRGESFLSWEELEIMKNAGISFGSHSMTHAYLPNMSIENMRYEVGESKRILQEQLGVPIKYFAYPIGGFTRNTKNMLQKFGYEAAVTTNRGHDRFDHDIFEINRIRFGERDVSSFYMWAKLSGYNYLFRKLKAAN